MNDDDYEERKRKLQERVNAFLEDVVTASQKHGLAISYQDYSCGFDVVDCEERHLNWLRAARCLAKIPEATTATEETASNPPLPLDSKTPSQS